MGRGRRRRGSRGGLARQLEQQFAAGEERAGRSGPGPGGVVCTRAASPHKRTHRPQFRFNVSFAEDELVAWIDVVALAEAANLTTLAAALTLANPAAFGATGCNAMALAGLNASAANSSSALNTTNSSGEALNSTLPCTSNGSAASAYFAAQAARASALFPWLGGGSDTLGPPLLSASPAIVYLALRVTATFGDVAVPGISAYDAFTAGADGVNGTWAALDPAGPASWAAVFPPELNVYVEAVGTDAEVAAAAGLVLPARALSPSLGGLPVSSSRDRPAGSVAADTVIAVAQVHRGKAMLLSFIHTRIRHRPPFLRPLMWALFAPLPQHTRIQCPCPTMPGPARLPRAPPPSSCPASRL